MTTNENLTQEAAGRVTEVHEAGEVGEGAAVVAAGGAGADSSASGGEQLFLTFSDEDGIY